MTSHLEVETKLELDPAGFQSLLRYGVIENTEDQLNIYFDDGWRLANSSGTCRVRMTKAGCSVLTLKVPISTHAHVRSMREFELLLSPRDKFVHSVGHRRISIEHELPSEWQLWLVQLGISELHRQGWVRNIRYTVFFQGLGCVALDHLKLPNGDVCFEAEIESSDLEVHSRLRALIERLVPSARPSSRSKFQRFVEAVKKVRDRSVSGEHG